MRLNLITEFHNNEIKKDPAKKTKIKSEIKNNLCKDVNNSDIKEGSYLRLQKIPYIKPISRKV